MIDKINNSQVPDILKQPSVKQPDPADAPVNNEEDVSLQVSCDSLIENAGQLPPEDTNLVQLAGELLLSGQLESPENIRQAAENIVTFGI